MPRAVTPEFLAALMSPHSRRLYAAELVFDSGVVRLNTSPYNCVLFGEEYSGVGRFGALQGIEETSQIETSAMTLTLTNIPNDMTSIALNEHYQGRPATVIFFLMDDEHRVIPNPIVLFRGRMNQMVVDVGTVTSATLSLENRYADWERPKALYYTNESHRLKPENANDRFFEFVDETAEKQIVWPNAQWFINDARRRV